MRILALLLTVGLVIPTLAFGEDPKFKVILERSIVAKEKPTQYLPLDGMAIAPTDGIRIKVINDKPLTQVDKNKAEGIERLQGVSKAIREVAIKLDNEFKQSKTEPITQATIEEIGDVLEKIDDLLPLNAEDRGPEVQKLSKEFRSRYNDKSRRITSEINRLADEKAHVNLINEGRTINKLKEVVLPKVSLLKLRALYETLDEVIGIAINDVLREGIYVRVGVDLYRNNDLSRIPDKGFLSPVNQASLNALMKIRDELRGTNGGSLDPSQLGKRLIERFKAEYKKMADEIEADLKLRIDGLRTDAQEILNKIQNPTVKQNYEALKKRLDGLTDRFQDIVDSAKELSRGTEGPSDGKLNDAALLGKWSSQLTALSTDSRDLIADTTKFVEDFKTWATTFEQQIDADVKARTAEINELFAKAQNTLREFVNSAMNNVQQTIKAQLEFLNVVDRLDKIESITRDGKDGWVDFPNKNGSLDGMGTLLASHDEVVIKVSARQDTESDYKQIGNEKGYRIGIFKNNRWDQLYAIAFAPRSTNSSRWQDALTFSWVFKKAYYNKSIQYNKMMPGFGLSMSVLDQSGDGVRELGIAGTLTLIDDKLITGYGYNLSEKRWFPFVGWRFRL